MRPAHDTQTAPATFSLFLKLGAAWLTSRNQNLARGTKKAATPDLNSQIVVLETEPMHECVRKHIIY